MRYETFLFTRNTRRDFTAFVRPQAMTNREVSQIARVFNAVNDITPFTADQPALYHFPLGDYAFVLRHYDSGRKHAGREIAVIEGIAVPQHDLDGFAEMLPHLVANHQTYLAVAATLADIEEQEVEASPHQDWPDGLPTFEVLLEDEARNYHDALQMNRATDRLLLPFNDDGRALLLATLCHVHTPPLTFAFGTNSDVVAGFADLGVSMDVIGYLATTEPALKPRDLAKPTPVVSPSPPPPQPPPEPERHSASSVRERSLIGVVAGLLSRLLGRR